MSDKTLIDYVNQAKARWLKRVMYSTAATSTQKVLAYAISDHLNCVTLDSWPGQQTLAGLLGRKAPRTIRRGAAGLAKLDFILINGAEEQASGCRYAPLFLDKDWDKIVGDPGQKRLKPADADVPQSFLNIQLESSYGAFRIKSSGNLPRTTFIPAQRGSIELKLAAMLGPNGLEVLSRLVLIHDSVVMRLCQAYSENLIGKRELMAARLAAEQARLS